MMGDKRWRWSSVLSSLILLLLHQTGESFIFNQIQFELQQKYSYHEVSDICFTIKNIVG